MNPTVFTLSRDEAGANPKTKKGDNLAGGVVIKVEQTVQVCYSKVNRECHACLRTECPFSNFKT